MEFSETIGQITLRIHTDRHLFSPRGIDRGTRAMLSLVDFRPDDKVLDLGCGTGVVGIYAAHFTDPKKVVMTDIDQRAVEISRLNARLNGKEEIRVYQSDGFNQIADTDFTVILSNPPYHSDFSTAKHFIEKGFNRLCLHGRFYMVTKRREWYKRKFLSIFGGVRIIERDGYFIFFAEKRSASYARSKAR